MGLFQAFKDHRKQQRIITRDFSRIHITPPEVEVNLVDLSLRGIRIMSRISLDLGNSLSLYLFDKTFRTQAKVCWVKRLDDQNEQEIGLHLELPDFSDLFEEINQENKLNLLILTALPFARASIESYVQLTNMNIQVIESFEELPASLKQHPWDLLLVDLKAEDSRTLTSILQDSVLPSSLPVILLTDRISKDMSEWRKQYFFVEIFRKPADPDEIVKRSFILREQSLRFQTMDQLRKKAIDELTNTQNMMNQQSQEMMTMLTQVMEQSEVMGHLIQLQEALMAMNSLNEVVLFAQQWAMQNFKASINLWHCATAPFYILGQEVPAHSQMNWDQRIGKINHLLGKSTKILQDGITLIRKNDIVLEVVAQEPGLDIVDRLTFFMKILIPVLLYKGNLQLQHPSS
ncbi:MAG: PilZ domain-containing protein [SAR324 cluster bacterium]|nr:PilZ domain-containing protein [SAR324 cluster bacterium]